MRIFFLYLLFIYYSAYGQKKYDTNNQVIDTTVLGTWPTLRESKISNDGNYISYQVDNLPIGQTTHVVQSTFREWKKEFKNISTGDFTNDSKSYVFRTSTDTLIISHLGTEEIKYIPYVSSYKISSKDILCYQLLASNRKLVLLNLHTGKERSFESVIDYSLNPVGNEVLINTDSIKDGKIYQRLQCVSLLEKTKKTIWEGEKISGFNFSNDGNEITFFSEDNSGTQPVYSLWYYQKEMSAAIMLVNDHSDGIEPGLVLDNTPVRISKMGNRILFYLKQKEFKRSVGESVKVDIWNYRDARLQSEQLKRSYYENFLAVVKIVLHSTGISTDNYSTPESTQKVIRLQQQNEEVLNDQFEGESNFILLISSGGGSQLEFNWNNTSSKAFYLVSMNDGSRKLLKGPCSDYYPYYLLSPSGDYIVSYDAEQQNYYSHEIRTGIIRNITQMIPTQWTVNGFDNPKLPCPIGIAAWCGQDKAILIYDNYDIWKIDLEGYKKPINMTNPFGEESQLRFRLANDINIVSSQSKLLLTAFNTKTKSNGFYQKKMKEKGNPELLSMGSYIYSYKYVSNFPPIKARDTDKWLVKRMSSSEAPNYFITSNFKEYEQLTNIAPNLNYNWLTTELINWKTFAGVSSQGVLYKPDNFEPTKKYPIIFYLYEKLSDKLNEFIYPNFCEGPINIPYLVSNGYLVFTPDIHYRLGVPGESAFDCVVSAAKYLTQMPWIDSSKMAIQGHSFGGYEVNYLVSRTSLFAAAMSAAGPSDLISDYGSLGGNGVGRQWIYETTQSRIGVNLWERPDLFINNSPIFKCDKISTPLLIMSNKNDTQVPFSQGLEYFLALRRLGKTAWMLQYDEGDHGVNRSDAKDYTIRLKQFFDHYLKGAPAPKWMLEGIPATEKGIDDGLELSKEVDANGKPITPGPGLLIPEEQKKVHELMKRKPMTIKLE